MRLSVSLTFLGLDQTLDRQGEAKLRAAGMIGFDPETAAMQLDEVPDDAQSETRVRVIFIDASAERRGRALSDHVHLLLRNSRSLIDDSNRDLRRRRGRFQDDFAVRCAKLDGIVEEILDNPAHLQAIGHERNFSRHALFDDGDRPLFGLIAEVVGGFVEDFDDAEDRRFKPG